MSIVDFFPKIANRSFFVKTGVLLLLMAVSFVIFNVVGLLIAIPFFGFDVVWNFDQGSDFTDPNQINFLKFIQFLSQLSLFVIPAFFYAFLENGKPLTYLGLKNKFKSSHLFLSVLLIFLSVPAINYLVVLNEQMDLPGFMSGVEDWMRKMEDDALRVTNTFLSVKSVPGVLVNLFIIALMASIGEELLFRGVILGILRDSMKHIHWAVFLSAIIFSAFHGQFYGFVPRAFLGIIFGYIFVWSASLWIPIILHFLFNSISVIAAWLYETGYITTSHEDLGESPPAYVVIGSFLLFVLLMFVFYRNRIKENSDKFLVNSS